jgi:hypothetical protein
MQSNPDGAATAGVPCNQTPSNHLIKVRSAEAPSARDQRPNSSIWQLRDESSSGTKPCIPAGPIQDTAGQLLCHVLVQLHSCRPGCSSRLPAWKTRSHWPADSEDSGKPHCAQGRHAGQRQKGDAGAAHPRSTVSGLVPRRGGRAGLAAGSVTISGWARATRPPHGVKKSIKRAVQAPQGCGTVSLHKHMQPFQAMRHAARNQGTSFLIRIGWVLRAG